MKMLTCFAGAMLAVSVLTTEQAKAQGANNPPPAGNVILDLAGQAIPHSYTRYTASFVATATSTNLTFAFREDPAFLSLDDVFLSTGGGANLLTNGGFESGVVGDHAPVGWTYVDVFGVAAAGEVSELAPRTGSNAYRDGAVQAYDAITQTVATTVGATYDLRFWLTDTSGLTTFQHLSTNGDTTSTGGNGADLVVYAGAVPTRVDAVPEPATWGLMLLGFCGLGAMLRRRRRVVLATA